ncbi:hypothetical protein HZS_3647 [Henneguya salminicola]|nr:hypothetical protein HZS_3647 [Henneguya salminicola]
MDGQTPYHNEPHTTARAILNDTKEPQFCQTISKGFMRNLWSEIVPYYIYKQNYILQFLKSIKCNSTVQNINSEISNEKRDMRQTLCTPLSQENFQNVRVLIKTVSVHDKT